MFDSYGTAHYFHYLGERKSTELCGLRNYYMAISTLLLIGPMNKVNRLYTSYDSKQKGEKSYNTLNSSYKTPCRGNGTTWKSEDYEGCSTEMSYIVLQSTHRLRISVPKLKEFQLALRSTKGESEEVSLTLVSCQMKRTAKFHISRLENKRLV